VHGTSKASDEEILAFSKQKGALVVTILAVSGATGPPVMTSTVSRAVRNLRRVHLAYTLGSGAPVDNLVHRGEEVRRAYPTPGPNFQNVKESGSADSHYYDWVDQFDTLGLGKNTPIATGNSSDSLLALVNGKFVVLRVPYPLGFFAKGMDGRIDDPKAGWKGKGVWTTWGTRTPFHSETGKGTMPKVVHFQMRPNPIAD
jgi:hypothetical protein